MTHDVSFEQERWAEIRDFPGYCISDRGRVQNETTGQFVTPTKNSHGLVMVGLMRRDAGEPRAIQHKRSLSLLVAREFVPRSRDEFDTPIHLNGDKQDNRRANLMWRPLWFARKYMRQFGDEHATIEIPIEDVETGEIYENTMHASTTLGILDIEIVLAMHNNTFVWPTGQVFREVIGR